MKTNAQYSSWGYQAVGIPDSYKSDFALTGKGVKIGIIDTGVDLNHPDLRVAGGVSFVSGTPSYQDDSGHGTQVAGIIAALDNDIGAVGVAPDAELYAIKTLDSKGKGNISDVIASVNWAIEHEMDIINLSFTSPNGTSLFETTLQAAYNKGILMVAASGNNLDPQANITDVLYPARYNTVLAVGSVNDKLNRSLFSYYGSNLDFVAPGEEIFSTSIGTDTQYVYTYGTSMAAPFCNGNRSLV